MFLQAVDTGPVSNPKPETDCVGKALNYQLGFLDDNTLFKQGQECLIQYFQPTHIFETPLISPVKITAKIHCVKYPSRWCLLGMKIGEVIIAVPRVGPS